MKKIISLFLTLLTLSVGQIWGAEEVYKTATFTASNCTNNSSYTGSVTCTVGTDSWTATNAANNNGGWNYIKLGKKEQSSNQTTQITTSAAYTDAVTKVVLTTSAINNSYVSSMKLQVASNSDFSSNLQEISIAVPSSAGAHTFTVTTPTANRYYRLVIVHKNTSKSNGAAMSITKVEYYHEAATGGHSITYNCDNADSGCPSNVTNQTALPNPLPDAPEKEGYTFDGWYTNSAKTTPAVAGAALSADVTLYAKWVEEICHETTTIFYPKQGAKPSAGSYNYKGVVTKDNSTNTNNSDASSLNGQTFTACNGTQISFSHTSGSTYNTIWYASSVYDMRLYQNNPVTFTAPSGYIVKSVSKTVGASTTSLTTDNKTTSFSYTKSGSGGEAVKYFTVVIEEACEDLDQINGSVSVTHNSATLEWDAIEGVTAWSVSGNIKNGAAIAAGNIGAITPINDGAQKQCVISNLSSSTAYEFQIHATTISSGYCTTVDEWDYEGSTDANYTITEATNNSSYGTVTRSGNAITGSPAQYCRYATPAYSVSPANSATVSQNGNTFTVTPSANTTVTINFEPIPVTGVTMSSNAETLEVGGTVDLTATVEPNTVNPNVTWQSSNTNIATVSNGTVTAVAAGSATITATSVGDNTKSATCAITVVPAVEYKKVTAALTDWSGEYLLVYEPDENTAYVYTGVDAASNYASITISNGKITKPAGGAKLTIASMEGGYSIQLTCNNESNNGKYLAAATSGNGTTFNAAAQANTISFADNAVQIQNTNGTNTATIKYNSAQNNYRFRYFGSGQQAVQLYRKVVTSAVTITAPAEGTGTLALANGQTAVASGDNIEAGTELTVTATPNAGNHYIGGVVKVVKTADPTVDVTSQVLSGTTLIMPEYAITVSATFTPTYAITQSGSGGTIAWETSAGSGNLPAYFEEGTDIVITANADDTHTFTSLSLSNNVENPDIDDNVAMFSMPASAVTATVVFAEKEDPSITVKNNVTSLTFGPVADNVSCDAQTFAISGANLEEGKLTVASNSNKFVISSTALDENGQMDVNGALGETVITVTPVTNVAGVFNGKVTISGGGLENAVEITLSLTVQQTYTANWIVNGDTEHPVKSITAVQGAELTFPAEDPSATGDCEGLVFQGWKVGAIDGTAASEPSYVNPENATMPVDGVNYYAVFAEGSSGDETESVTWSTIYDEQTDVEGQELAIGASAKVTFNKGTNSNKCQYYTTGSAIRVYGGGNFVVSAPGTITSITLTFGSGDNSNEITANVGTYSDGSWTGEANSVTFSIGGTSNHRRIAGISVTYSASSLSGWVTTCPQCSKVTLQKVIAGEGAEAAGNAIAFSPASTTVKTCEAAEVTVNPTIATGWELKSVVPTSVAGVTYDAGVISIPAEATGELTVTATFGLKDYTVTVNQTEGAGATLSGAADDAHYGATINLSATNIPANAQFVNWTSDDVEITNPTSATEASFTMPAKDITVTANFIAVHDVAWAIENTPSSGMSDFVYVKGIISSMGTESEGIQITDKYNNATYYISDLDENGNPVNSYEVYRGKNVGNTDFATVNDLKVGDEVIVYGKLKTYSSVKEFDAGNYIITDGLKSASLSSVVVSAPDASQVKTEYFTGETFLYAGLNARAVYSTGYQQDVTNAATFKANGSASLTVTANATVNVTATWSETTSADYPVTISVTTKVLQPDLTLSESALTGYLGQALPKPTTITAHFIDNTVPSTENVTLLAVIDENDAYDASLTTEQTIPVKYTFGPNDATANYTVTLSSIVNNLNSAYSVAKAQEIIDIDRVEGNDLDLEVEGNKVYVTGVVTSKSGSGPYTIQIKDNTTDEAFLELYKCTLGTNVTGVQVGDVVKAYGNLKWFASLSKYELDEGGQVVAVARTPNFTIADVAEMEVNITADLAEADLTIERGGSEGAITFSCTDPAVTIVNNKLRAAAEGDATVTATIAANGEGAMSFAETSTTFDVHVIAERQRYAVNFDADGGSGDAPVVANQLPGVPVDLPANTFTKTDMRFTGWVVTNNSTSAVIAQEDGHFTMPAAPVTLTAQWVAKTYCALTLRINGVDQTPFNVERLEANNLSEHNPETTNGYDFYGWASLDSDVEEDVTEAITTLPGHIFTPAIDEESKTLYAVFKKAESGENQHYVLDYTDENLATNTNWGAYATAYDYTAADGGEWTIKAYKNNGMQINVNVNDPHIKVPNCPANIIQIVLTCNSGAKNAVKFAETIEGESIANGSASTSQTLDLSEASVTTGYILPTGNCQITHIDVEYNGNYTYYTTRPVVRHMVTYDANGGSNAPAAAKTDVNGKVTVTSETPTAPEGKVFYCWNANEDGTGAIYWAGDKVAASDADVTIYATWRDLPATEAIATIGGKFIISNLGDTAVFSRGNLQHQMSTNTWRCAPNQYDWAGVAANKQIGNLAYEGWVDLFCWSMGDANNYGATSAYHSADYYNKNFVDWGGLFEGDWATLSSTQWKYLLNSRSGANDKWGMAMIGDTLGMILLPEEWTAPAGITFVPRTNPTSDLWDENDRLDPSTQDHCRVKPENMPANKFTLEEWAQLEAAGAIFLPYAGRRSGGYGNHTNRDDVEVGYEYNYTYYENYLGTYWTSTMSNPEEGKADYVYTLNCKKVNNEDVYSWGKAVVWGESGRYGQSVRLVHIIPRQYTVTYDANGATSGSVPVNENKYSDGATVPVADKGDLVREGYAFAGWKFKGVTYKPGDNYTISNVLYNEEIVFEAQWSAPSDYVLVTKATQLADGDQIIIAAAGNYDFAMGTQNSGNYRNRVEIAKTEDKKRICLVEEPVVFTLGVDGNYFTFYKEGEGYLCATSSSKNYIGIQTELDNNGKWAISVTTDDNGVVKASIVAQGDNSKNTMQYNSGSPRFSCYGSASEQAVALYKIPRPVVVPENGSMDASDIATNSSVTVGDGATLTVDEEKELDNLIVEAGGKVNGANNLEVKDLTIKTSLGIVDGETETETGGKSIEITNPDNVLANGEVWIEIELTQEAQASVGWYAFSVPFRVDAMNGVYYQNNKLQNEVGYAIMSYHGDIRATGEYGWKKFRGIMEPGVFYVITVGNTDYKTLRFKKVADSKLFNDNDVLDGNKMSVNAYTYSGAGTSTDAGWNGLGNPYLAPAKVSGVDLQLYDHDLNRFWQYEGSNVNMMVGRAFFYQYQSSSSITINMSDEGIALAPARAMSSIEQTTFKVYLRNEAGRLEDKVFLRTSEDATNDYESGRDLAKMSMGNAKCAQMWIPAYGTQLCAADFPLVNNKVTYPLIINTLAAGTYTISAAETSENATLYLTKNGRIYWNLTMGACELDLNQGQNNEYGLVLRAEVPAVTTGVDEINAEAGVQKVVIDEHVYILRGGEMYDMTGKMVK